MSLLNLVILKFHRALLITFIIRVKKPLLLWFWFLFKLIVIFFRVKVFVALPLVFSSSNSFTPLEKFLLIFWSGVSWLCRIISQPTLSVAERNISSSLGSWISLFIILSSLPRSWFIIVCLCNSFSSSLFQKCFLLRFLLSFKTYYRFSLRSELFLKELFKGLRLWNGKIINIFHFISLWRGFQRLDRSVCLIIYYDQLRLFLLWLHMLLNHFLLNFPHLLLLLLLLITSKFKRWFQVLILSWSIWFYRCIQILDWTQYLIWVLYYRWSELGKLREVLLCWKWLRRRYLNFSLIHWGNNVLVVHQSVLQVLY